MKPMQKDKFKDLTELDHLRIKFILDYWYDDESLSVKDDNHG